VGNCTGPIYGSGFSTQITLSVVIGAAKSATTADSRGPGPPPARRLSTKFLLINLLSYIYNFFLLSSQIGTSMPSEDGGGNLSTAALPNILEYGN
jgi:hypothetical protein